MGRVPAVIAAILVSVTSAVVRAGDATDPPSASGPPEVVIEPHDIPVPAEPHDVPAPVQPVAPAAPAAPGATPTPAIAAAVAVTPPRPTRETHGLALAAGFGIEYGVLGLQARYDIPIRPRLIVSPFVSAGINFGLLSGPIGVSTALGTRHRFVVDLGVAPLDRFRLWVHGTPVADGPSLARCWPPATSTCPTAVGFSAPPSKLRTKPGVRWPFRSTRIWCSSPGSRSAGGSGDAPQACVARARGAVRSGVRSRSALRPPRVRHSGGRLPEHGGGRRRLPAWRRSGRRPGDGRTPGGFHRAGRGDAAHARTGRVVPPLERRARGASLGAS